MLRRAAQFIIPLACCILAYCLPGLAAPAEDGSYGDPFLQRPATGALAGPATRTPTQPTGPIRLTSGPAPLAAGVDPSQPRLPFGSPPLGPEPRGGNRRMSTGEPDDSPSDVPPYARRPEPRRYDRPPAEQDRRRTSTDSDAQDHPYDRHPAPAHRGNDDRDRRGAMQVRRPGTGAAPWTRDDRGQLIDSATKVGQVGDEVILAGDALGPIEVRLAELIRLGKATAEQADEFRRQELRKRLPGIIESKMVLVDAKRSIPPEALPEIRKRSDQQFEEVQLPKLTEQLNVQSRAQLDVVLRQAGSSLLQQKQLFFERAVFTQWIRQQVDRNPEVTHDEMLRYYYEHQPEFSSKPKVKWEELMISRSRIPDAQAARNAVAKLGNEVIVGRRSFADVARAGSHGVTADKGGLHDWTTQGSLVSEVLDHALFSIELGRMSKILEDKDGFHIIRVVDRTPGGVTPFRQAQVEIREKLRKEKSDKAIVDYLARIRETTQIWTIFDGDPSGALPGR